jgi:tetratricopeptide (TPR) repeat protein
MSTQMNKRVFVSSTFMDLKAFREAVRNAIRQLGAIDISMEHFGARDERPKAECLRLIREDSEVFVGIYAHRYGHVPEGDEISITEAEYDAATVSGMPRFIYLVDEATPWVLAHVDKGRAKTSLLKLKKKLKASRVFDTFTSADDLATKVAADLGRHFSANREAGETGRAGRSSLPHQPYFFGRKEELKKIADALLPELRSWGVLIDGPGGIGKTALAVRAGHLAPAENFPLKIFLTAKVRELTPAGEQQFQDFMLPNFIALVSELAAELGEEEIGRTPANERTNIVRRILADKHALIIIDNVETFDEQERVRLYQFLSRLPGACKAIVTSRRRTDIDARVIRLDRLAPDEALELIAELAKSNRRLARASIKERQDLYEITGGNPLLIKWVVGQLGRTGSQCSTIAEACAFIESAPKDNDPLEYIFGDLLDTFTESETAVLAALTHFTLPAKVEWIAELSGLAQPVAQTALEDLADRAILVSDETAQTFILPALAATFLRRKCPEAVAETGNRLTDHVYALALENGYQNHERFPKLEAEWPTIAAALPLFLQGENARLQELCDALEYFLDFSGRWDERLSLELQAEEKALAVSDFYNAGLRAYQMGWVYYLQGQASELLACIARWEEHWQKVAAVPENRAHAIRFRGLGHFLEKNYPAAIAAFQEAKELFSVDARQSINLASVLNDIAMCEKGSGDFAAAERNYREALRIAKKINYQEGIAVYTGNLAALALDNRDWPGAEVLAREALALTEALGRIEMIGADCSRLAKALAQQGRPHEGLPYAHRAVELLLNLRQPQRLEYAKAALKECEKGLDEAQR